MLDVIPLGQPILVGHYSEKADRNYRERANNKITKGYATLNEAKRLEQRVQAAGQNKAIFLDDPDATEKLETKIARLEARQKRMKAANKLVRANDRDGLRDMGFSEVVIQQLFEPDFMGRIGFANYLLTNNNANIRRLKKRLTTIAQYVNDETTERPSAMCGSLIMPMKTACKFSFQISPLMLCALCSSPMVFVGRPHSVAGKHIAETTPLIGQNKSLNYLLCQKNKC